MKKDKEKRKYPRVRIYSPISYICEDSEGNSLEQNMAVARDVSQSGIQIETFHMIQSNYILLMFLDLDNDLIEARGRVIYCKKVEPRKYRTGINLQGSNRDNIKFVRELVKSFHYKKETSQMKITPSQTN
jgi:hypothetical protein